MTKISLDAEDFKTLVEGGIITYDGVQILLQDIGWHVMLNTIKKAIDNPPDQIKYNFICEGCGTKYGSTESTPPPSPNWDDGHICEPKLVT